MDDDKERHRIARLEAEAELRPRAGRCLTCGKYREELLAGRVGGFRVYCDICAIGTRTASMRGSGT